MKDKRIMRCAVLMAVLIAAVWAALGLFSRPLVAAQVGEPPPVLGNLQTAPLANGVDPFSMTLAPSKDT
jgi:hypothetical protein